MLAGKVAGKTAALLNRFALYNKRVTSMSINQMTGVEFWQSMITGEIPHPPMTETIPMSIVSAKKGMTLFEVKADDRHLNPVGGVHGGFAATVMDSVTASAVHTMLEAGVGYATVDLNVKMLRSVPKNVKLLAKGEIINISKSIGVSEGTLKDEKGKLYAHSTATYMILR